MVLVHLATGFEEIEALTVVDLLRRAEIEVNLVSTTGEKQVKGCHNIAIEADILIEDVKYEECDMIVLPGGLPGAFGLRDHAILTEQIKNFAAEGKGIAAICAAPLVLGCAGVLNGKKATIYPGMEEHLTGATPIKEKVVKDGNMITSQGPATAMVFALAIVEHFVGKEKAEEIGKGLLL